MSAQQLAVVTVHAVAFISWFDHEGSYNEKLALTGFPDLSTHQREVL